MSNLDVLQNKVFVEIMLHLCNGGRENLRDMTRGDFHILTDFGGNKYVCVSKKTTKNHRGDVKNEKSQKGRMCETYTSRDPVSSFEKYVTKLHPDCDGF